MSRSNDILAPRRGETDEEQRLREALNRHAGQFMAALDATLRLRTAGGSVKRMRNRARNGLEDACLRSMEALALVSGVLPHDDRDP